MKRYFYKASAWLMLGLVSACQASESSKTPDSAVKDYVSLKVTATAYTSSAAETNDQPNLGAWGDRLQPGMKAVAVSRDLLDQGLSHGSTIKIDGLPGEYRVLDKMHRRWEKKIDIYMGNNVEQALEWGKQTVVIRWPEE